jgi:hypothetical protein
MKHAVIPDVQVKPGADFGFLKAIGNYLVAKRPDTVVCIGDFADMPSLSSYDVGKKSFEGRRYRSDIEATHEGMEALLAPINDYNRRAKANHKERYSPRFVLTLGNHEHRISRATDDDPKLDGTIGLSDLNYEEFGWEVIPYLQPIVIDGVAYCHYFTSGVLGRPCTTAQAQLTKKHMSCIAGHQQGLQFASSYRADGKRLTSIIAGSCYEHDEGYLNHQTNKHWRGIIMLHEVEDGEFDLMPVSLTYLKGKYASTN